MIETTGIPIAPASVGSSARNYEAENITRMNWIMALSSAGALVKFTRTKLDDVALADLLELFMDQRRWSRLADAIYEKPK